MDVSRKSKAELVRQLNELEAKLRKVQDADERRAAAEGRLKESEKQLKALTGNIPLGLYRRTCGPEGKLVMVNPALVKMFRYDSEAELNQVPVVHLYYHPEQCVDFSNKLFTNGDVIREELKMRRKDGTSFFVVVTTRVISDDDGRPEFFDGIMEDITEQKRAEEEEALRREQLLQADKMISLGILVSGVAHEINNPAQFIVSNAGPLQKVWEDATPILERYYAENGDFMLGGQRYSIRKKRVLEMFRNIMEGTDRIKHIVNELRDYAKENPADVTGEVDINEVLQSALSLLQNLIKKTTGQFFVTYGKSLPRFMGDYRRIEQVIINLVQNACQAILGNAGKISITTFYETEGQRVGIQINDTGCGIPPENLRRITDPFFTTKRAVGGTGLGLSISQTIVSEHRGALEFASEVGEGTTVKLYLPACGERGGTAREGGVGG